MSDSALQTQTGHETLLAEFTVAKDVRPDFSLLEQPDALIKIDLVDSCGYR